jgi:hypothetical protein
MLSRRATSSVSCVPTRSWTNLRWAALPPREPESSSASMRPQATCDPQPSRLCTSWDRGGAAVQAAVGPTTPCLIPSHPRLPPAPAAAQAASSGGDGGVATSNSSSLFFDRATLRRTYLRSPTPAPSCRSRARCAAIQNSPRSHAWQRASRRAVAVRSTDTSGDPACYALSARRKQWRV